MNFKKNEKILFIYTAKLGDIYKGSSLIIYLVKSYKRYYLSAYFEVKNEKNLYYIDTIKLDKNLEEMSEEDIGRLVDMHGENIVLSQNFTNKYLSVILNQMKVNNNS